MNISDAVCPRLLLKRIAMSVFANPLSRFGKVFRCIRRFGVSHGSHVEPGLTPKRLTGLHAINYPNLLTTLAVTVIVHNGVTRNVSTGWTRRANCCCQG